MVHVFRFYKKKSLPCVEYDSVLSLLIQTVSDIINECSKLADKEFQDHAWLGGKGNTLRIVQEIKIWPWWQVVNAQIRILLKHEMQKISLRFSGAHGVRRCPRCNGYRRRKRTRRHEFKSWTRLIVFYIALIPLGKVWIQLFSLKLWVNSRAD